MKQYLNIGKEPDLQKIVIASVILHVLFVALAAVPLRTKEREYKSYFVNLVSPTEMQRTPDNISPGEAFSKAEETVKKTEPEKENQNDKTQLNKAKSGEQSSLNKTLGNREISSSELLWQIENSTIPSKQEFEIVSKLQKSKGTYHQDSIPADKGYSGTTFASKKGSREKQFVIARGNGTNRTETLIEGMKSDLHGNPDIDFNGNDQGVSFGQREGSKIIEKPGSSGKSEDISAYSRGKGRGSDDDGLLTSEISTHGGSSAGGGGSAIIAKPGSSGGGGSGDGGTVYSRQGGAQGASNADSGGGGTGSDDDEGISIKGVPLRDLIACTNALDEGILKKKILNIIGSKKDCYSPTAGKYIFSGTNRYTSFEMIIVPVSGRKLSNRCDELKNALFCLNQ